MANDDVSSTIGGTFNLADGRGNVISGSFDDTATQVMSYADASGAAFVNFQNSFSALPAINGDPARLDIMVSGTVGGDVGDRDGNLVIAGQRVTFHGPGMTSMEGSVLESRLSQFVNLSTDSQTVMIDSASVEASYQLDVAVDSFLSNVDRKDGTSPTASIGEGGVRIYLMENTQATEMTTLNQGKGSIFAMKRTVSE